MQKEDIRLQQVIIHIMDSSMGMPVLSDQVLDHGSDFGDRSEYKSQSSGTGF